MIQQISFYYDYKQDESYTPLRVSVRGGTAFHDLKELVNVEMEPITGWANITLEDIPGSGRPPRVFLLQLAIISNQLGGRDTHVRQLKLFSAREPTVSENDEIPFTEPEFLLYSRIR
ncbi:Anaphase-promoting complex subunit 10 [Mortierella sp. AM989]|nr:Anaphase-promoting complex subunit 10 [Mortierella sp. AM989]